MTAPVSRFALLFIFLTALMDSVGFGIIMPVLPDLIMQVSGENLPAAAQYGGWLMFIYAIMQFFCAPVIGNLSDDSDADRYFYCHYLSWASTIY